MTRFVYPVTKAPAADTLKRAGYPDAHPRWPLGHVHLAVVNPQMMTTVLVFVRPIPAIAAIVALNPQLVLGDGHDHVLVVLGVRQLQVLDLVGHLLQANREKVLAPVDVLVPERAVAATVDDEPVILRARPGAFRDLFQLATRFSALVLLIPDSAGSAFWYQ